MSDFLGVIAAIEPLGWLFLAGSLVMLWALVALLLKDDDFTSVDAGEGNSEPVGGTIPPAPRRPTDSAPRKAA